MCPYGERIRCYGSSHVIVSSSLNDQSHIVRPREIDTFLHILRTSGIDNIDWIPLSAAGDVRVREAGVVVEIIADCADRIFCLPGRSVPV